MTKAGIRLIFRSKETEEVAIGDHRYTYTVSPLLIARISSKSYTHDDTDSINQNTKSKLRFDVLLPNDASDRVNRISHILYMGSFYKVGAIRPYPPRVSLTVEDLELSELKSELEQRVNETARKSQNELKIDAFDHLGVSMTPPSESDELKKGLMVLKDGIIQVWDGEKYIDILKFIKEHTNGACIPNTIGNVVTPSSEGTTSAGVSSGISPGVSSGLSPGTPIPDTDHGHWDEL